MTPRTTFYQALDAIDGLNLQHSLEIIESWRKGTPRPSEEKLRITKAILLHKLGWSVHDFDEELEHQLKGLGCAIAADLMENLNERIGAKKTA